jgi:hypothetical protein
VGSGADQKPLACEDGCPAALAAKKTKCLYLKMLSLVDTNLTVILYKNTKKAQQAKR